MEPQIRLSYPERLEIALVESNIALRLIQDEWLAQLFLALGTCFLGAFAGFLLSPLTTRSPDGYVVNWPVVALLGVVLLIFLGVYGYFLYSVVRTRRQIRESVASQRFLLLSGHRYEAMTPAQLATLFPERERRREG